MESVAVLATIPAILAIVNLGKRLGLDSKFALVAAVVVGVVISVANFYLGEHGGYQAAVSGLLLGLSAAGLYDVAKTSGSKE